MRNEPPHLNHLYYYDTEKNHPSQQIYNKSFETKCLGIPNNLATQVSVPVLSQTTKLTPTDK